MKMKSIQTNFSKILATILVALSLIQLSLFGLIAITQPAVIEAQAQEFFNSNSGFNNHFQNTSDTLTIDPNSVATDFDSQFQFLDRIYATKSTQLLAEPCGITSDFSINSGEFGRVLKSLSVSGCDSENWLKVGFDSGKTGFISSQDVSFYASANETFFNQNSATTLNAVTSNSTTFSNTFNESNFTLLSENETSTLSPLEQKKQELLQIYDSNGDNKLICSDFTTTVTDLDILSVFPNLDLDDDGVGCEANSSRISAPPSIVQEYDTNNNGKVTCNDFEFQVYDPQILAFFPDLDREGDGIGCESNKKPEAFHIVRGTVPAPEDAFFADIDKMEFEIFDGMEEQDPLFDLMSVGGNLMKLLNEDFNKLSGQSIPCSVNILVCFGYNSIAAFGMNALWFFHFISGIVVGLAQSISDLVMQIIDLATNATTVISEMIDGIKQIWNDPSLLLKIFQSSLTEMVQSDTMGRAFLIGKFIVPFIEDALLALLTGVALAIAKNLVTTLKNSQKLGSSIVKISNFVNKSIKIGRSGGYGLIVKQLINGVGFAGREVRQVITKLSDTEWTKFVNKITDQSKRNLLEKYRAILKTCGLVPGSSNLCSVPTQIAESILKNNGDPSKTIRYSQPSGKLVWLEIGDI
jgi:Ca2+-binding EF-hand superfamily protein